MRKFLPVAGIKMSRLPFHCTIIWNFLSPDKIEKLARFQNLTHVADKN